MFVTFQFGYDRRLNVLPKDVNDHKNDYGNCCSYSEKELYCISVEFMYGRVSFTYRRSSELVRV